MKKLLYIIGFLSLIFAQEVGRYEIKQVTIPTIFYHDTKDLDTTIFDFQVMDVLFDNATGDMYELFIEYSDDESYYWKNKIEWNVLEKDSLYKYPSGSIIEDEVGQRFIIFKGRPFPISKQ